MKILITGEPGIGKTAVVKRILKELGKKAVGFWTEEVRDPKTGKRIGFKVISTEGKSAIFASKTFTSKHLVGSYGVNVKRFEEVALPVLKRALEEKEKVVVIDEVGKMELFSKTFMELAQELLHNPKYRVIATIPIRDVHPIVADIRRMRGVVLLEVTKENRDILHEIVIELILNH
ncbi:MAG: NTPase [Acidobacteria bacterium]|jgi:nucleoside-triphosphatase|nr:MAG: NTPase [Acidobacteriota bacterium]